MKKHNSFISADENLLLAIVAQNEAANPDQLLDVMAGLDESPMFAQMVAEMRLGERSGASENFYLRELAARMFLAGRLAPTLYGPKTTPVPLQSIFCELVGGAN